MPTSSRGQAPITANARGFGYLVFVLASAAAAAVACGGGNINPPDVTLTVALEGNGRGTVTGSIGGINCTNASGSASGTCQAGMNKNTEVTLSASAATGSTFAGWSGSGVSCDVSAPCTITADADRSVTATFNGVAATQMLTVVGGGDGTGSGHIKSDPAGIDCDITSGVAGATGCSASFDTDAAVELQVESGNFVAWGGACGGTTCSVTMTDALTVIATFGSDVQATQLAFVGQPSGSQLGDVISPPVQVAIQDAGKQTVAGRTDAITLQIGANPGNATLGGTLTQNAVNGVATFSDLTLNQKGADYTLVALTPQLPSATSAAFTVSDVPVAHLAFRAQPANTQAGATMTPVTVEIQDQNNAVLTSRTDLITISPQNNPTGATLNGNLSAPAVAGVATFSNLMMVKAGTGYTLSAATGNASGAISTAFDIAAGAPFLMVRIGAESRTAPAGTAVATADRPSVRIEDAFKNPIKDVPVDWKVTAGDGGQVDPASKATGPLGVSTVSSWTLSLDVGANNNELQASRAGLIGSPASFKASSTIPSGQGIFTGKVLETSNLGFDEPPIPIQNATLTFVNLNNPGTPAGTTQSKSDGSFASRPLPGGNPYKIVITAPRKKEITYQKPSLNAGTSSSLGNLGMVLFATGDGTAGFGFTIKVEDVPVPDQEFPVRVEVYRGYDVGESDHGDPCGPGTEIEVCSAETTANILESITQVGRDENGAVVSNSAQIQVDQLGDWGPLTVRVLVAGQSKERVIVLDKPVDIFRWDCEDPNRPADDPTQDIKCIDAFKFDPTP